MKKIMQVLVAVMISAVFVTNVSAAGNDTLLNYAKQGYVVNGKRVYLTAGDLHSLETFLASNDLTDAQANEIIGQADTIVAVMNREGVSDVTKLSKNAKNEVLSIAQSAASVAGVTLNYDKDNKTIVATDKNGAEIPFSLSPYLRPTSNNYVIVAAIVATLGATSFVVLRKRNA